MESLLAIDLGTYCDNKLMEHVLTSLKHRYKIIYVTDERHKVPKGSDVVVEHYHTPSFFVNEPNLRASNSSYNFNMWMLMNPIKAREAYVWRNVMQDMLHKLIEKHHPVGMLVMYPAAGMLWMLKSEAVRNMPIFVLYYAPGMLNASVPWLFDSAMQDESVPLFQSDKKNIASGEEYINRISSMSVRRESAMDVYFEAYHVMCWHNTGLMPKLVTDKRMKMLYAGTLLPPNIDCNNNGGESKKMRVPRAIRSQLRRGDANIIFVSFGSYTNSALLQRYLHLLIEFLEAYCEAHPGYKVIFHNGAHNTKHIISVRGYVPYEVMVPRCSLVVLTGSACLQNTCMYHGVPMLFVPQLNEQFFWARLYKRNTGVDFINIRTSLRDVQQHLRQHVDIGAVTRDGAAFRKKLAASMQKDHRNTASNASQRLADIVARFKRKGI